MPRRSQKAERLASQRLAISREEREITKAVRDFFLNDVIRQADSAKQLDRNYKPNPNLTVREALNRAATAIDGRFNVPGESVNKEASEAAVRLRWRIPSSPSANTSPPWRSMSKLAIREKTLGPDHRHTGGHARGP